MLLSLHVKNMALLKELEVDFSKGLNILTGETGAGKSILIGSINVALGAKGFKEFVGSEQENALVELVFLVDSLTQRAQIKEMELPLEEDGQLIITRKLNNGRSISRVNGETVPVSQIKELASILIDIHGQHEHQSLLYPKNHLRILDEYANEVLSPYKEEGIRIHKKYQELSGKLKETELDEAARVKEVDFLEYEIKEIEDAGLTVGEDEELEARYKKMSNSRKIMEQVSEAYALTGSDGSASVQVSRALRCLNGAAGFDEELAGLDSQLLDIDNLLGDFNREISNYIESLSFDQGDFTKIEERLDTLNHLKAKYGKKLEAVLNYQMEKIKRLDELKNYEVFRKKLLKETVLWEEKLWENAKEMSKIRKEYAKTLGSMIQDGLVSLNFLKVNFEIQVQMVEHAGSNGADEVRFMISTNPGQPVQALGNVASGGELSRIMLAIKTVLADKDETETLIFDEIDVGISGRTAQMVSEKLAVIAASHQVLCITHLAQIAAMSDVHFVIEKTVEDDDTTTAIRPLNQEESIEEIARILGGAQITATVMDSAREMKELALCTKKY